MSSGRKFTIKSLFSTGSNSGLTLIECLVAIALMGLTSAVIAPVMVFSVATRVQSQRAEQALQIAQGEVENVRLMMERGNDISTVLSNYPNPIANPTSTTTTIAATAGPTSYNTGSNKYEFTSDFQTAKPVNIDDDAEDEFAVQMFRTVGIGSPPVAFEIGVRVYDIRAFADTSGSALSTAPASLSLTSGEGERGSQPLAVIYTDIFKGDRDDALCKYREHLNSTATTSVSMDGINCT